MTPALKKTCPNCGTEFETAYVSNKFCRGECKRIFKNKLANQAWAATTTQPYKSTAHKKNKHWTGGNIAVNPDRIWP